MFAVLGTVQFELITYVEGMELQAARTMAGLSMPVSRLK